MKKKEWFEEWFDSPYYDMLYQHRDENEARGFISNLSKKLNLQPNHKILDLACGKGRHSIALNKLGFDVVGVDLSRREINYAKQFENDRLKFQVGDMREVVKRNHFTHIFNLFTSFGYFSEPEDNKKVIEAIYQSLLPSGIFILDFLNTDNLKIDKEKKLTLESNNVQFFITKKLEGSRIIKEIKVIDGNKSYSFNEKVTAFSFKSLKALILSSPFEIINVYGDYNLNSFHQKTSDRVIVLAIKKGE